MRRIIILLFISCLSICWGQAKDISWGCKQEIDKGSNILFIGNSYTYGNALPTMLQAFCDHRKHQVKIDSYTAGGASLANHWKNPQVQRKLDSKKWAVVILQDQSMTPILIPQNTLQFGAQFCKKIKNQGGEPVLYLTWGRRSTNGTPIQEDEAGLKKTYTQLAQHENATVSPVGIAWRNCLTKHPNIPLYAPDGKHPTVQGSYLTACVIYCTLFLKSPLGLPEKISLSNKTFCKLSSIQTKALQQVAWDTFIALHPKGILKKPTTSTPHNTKSTGTQP